MRGRRGLLLAGLTLVALALRLWRLGELPLFADEAYYLLWADRPAAAYFDHPAGVAVLLRLSTLLGGAGEWGIRWLNALLSTACVPLVYAVGRRYVSAAGGLSAAAAAALAPVYVITGRVVYPDALQGCLLLATLLAAWPAVQGAVARQGHGMARHTARRRNSAADTTKCAEAHSKGTGGPRLADWAVLGLCSGLLLNTKLTALFMVGGLALGMLLWQRRWLRTAGPWLAAAIALTCLVPYLAWNAGHGWTSLRLAWTQGGGFGGAAPGLLERAAHAWHYLSPPAALLAGYAALAAIWSFVAAKRRFDLGAGPHLLALVAACLLAPVLLSAADSPRNLGPGLLALWPLAGLGTRWFAPIGRNAPSLVGIDPGSNDFGHSTLPTTEVVTLKRGFFSVAIALLFLAMALYAAGTVAGLLGPAALPRSSAADGIRADGAGWQEFGRDFAAPPGSLVFAVDYSIAGQLAYYSGRPVYSAAGQFRIWGAPDADDWTVLAQGYLPPQTITARLRAGFADVTGPIAAPVGPAETGKVVYIWQAGGRRTPTAQLVEELDYLRLAGEPAASSDTLSAR